MACSFELKTLAVYPLALGLVCSACVLAPDGDELDDGGSTTAAGSSDEFGSTDPEPPSGTDEGADETGQPVPPLPDDAAQLLLSDLAGLWVAPVTSMTSVGNFPIMAMDMRPVDDRTVFSRVDLDADNNLRFLFTIETVDGEPTLVFRNGGEFLGFLRDTRTSLVEYDEAEATWRLCAIGGGCDYVEALIARPDEDTLVVSASVLGRPHMHWEGRREEPRTLDGAFPYDDAAGSVTDPFPPMPTLRATLSWPEPVTEPTEAWIVLTTTACTLVPGSCSPSRFMRATVPAGATSVQLDLEQIHPGDYQATAVLDHNGNMATTLFPDSGDRVSLPNQAVTVAERGVSETNVMLLVEL